MKKLIYLFLASAILISCSSSDDDSLDPIIGSWKLQSVIEDGVETSTECQRQTTVTFSENGTTQSKSYYDDGNGCESDSDTSTWVNVGGSTYRIDSDDEATKINFSQNNTVFSGSFSETYNGATYTTTISYKKI